MLNKYFLQFSDIFYTPCKENPSNGKYKKYTLQIMFGIANFTFNVFSDNLMLDNQQNFQKYTNMGK